MKKKTIYILSFVAVLLLLVGGAVAYVAYSAVMAPVVKNDQTVYVQVYPGDDVRRVEEVLTSVVDFKTTAAFAPLMKHYKYETRVKPGNYAIRPGDSMRDICLRLLSGNQTPVKLVLPSVRTLDRLAGAVSKQIMTDSAAVMDLLTDVRFLDSLGYTSETIPCLFIPNTYEVYWTMSPKQFVTRMVKERNAFWTPARTAKAKALGLTPNEVITLASIVDEETAKDDENPMVAGLYLNRLKRGMLLQADPTVIYGMGRNFSGRLLFKHLEDEKNLYNTYRHKGLPPGPICSFGADALKAAKNPEEHKFLYFVATGKGREHKFSKSLKEHNIAVQEYRAAMRKKKTASL